MSRTGIEEATNSVASSERSTPARRDCRLAERLCRDQRPDRLGRELIGGAPAGQPVGIGGGDPVGEARERGRGVECERIRERGRRVLPGALRVERDLGNTV